MDLLTDFLGRPFSVSVRVVGFPDFLAGLLSTFLLPSPRNSLAISYLSKTLKPPHYFLSVFPLSNFCSTSSNGRSAGSSGRTHGSWYFTQTLELDCFIFCPLSSEKCWFILARNLTEEEKRGYKEVKWDDKEVCAFYMVRFCPHDLFVNTRSDLGELYASLCLDSVQNFVS